MRLLAALLALTATLSAHPSWKQTTAEVTAEGDRLRIELRIDVPPYLLGRIPQAVEVRELDDLMFGDQSGLGRRLSDAPSRLATELSAEVDGAPLPLATPEFPTAEAVLTQMRSQPEADRYPVILPVTTRTLLPSGEGQLRVRFPATVGNVLITFRTTPERIDMVVVPAGEWSDPVPVSGPTRGFLAMCLGFLRAGFGHVLPDGWDHALFMLAMFLGAPSPRMAMLRSLSFTLGHSLTLGLVWFGVLASPGAWIEPLIAASIVTAGVLAALGRNTARWALAGACAFGLLHGLGFAAAASFTGGGSIEALGALAGFNLGVEAAQLLVIAGACCLVLPWTDRPWFERRLRRPFAWATALGGFWLLCEMF